MDQEKFDKLIEGLRLAKNYCNYQHCDETCIFNVEFGCMFFNKPFNWELGLAVEKYEK